VHVIKKLRATSVALKLKKQLQRATVEGGIL
jgi:hypothetical protein